MDNRHLHAILQEIWANISCKQCNAKLDVNNAKLLKQGGNSASFEVKCENCWGMMQISAEMTSGPPKKWVPIKKESIKQNKQHFLKGKIVETLIKDEEVWMVSKLLTQSASFKDLFWVFLVFILVLFSGCEKETDMDKFKEDTVTNIREAKDFWSKLFEDWKEAYNWVSEVLKWAPAKIDAIKQDTEKLIEDVKEIKEGAEEKIEQTRDIINKINEATKSTKEALDAISDMTTTTWATASGDLVE